MTHHRSRRFGDLVLFLQHDDLDRGLLHAAHRLLFRAFHRGSPSRS